MSNRKGIKVYFFFQGTDCLKKCQTKNEFGKHASHASCCKLLRVVASYLSSGISHTLLLLLYCYLLITASFGSPEPSLAPRIRTFLFLMHIFSGCP